MGVIIGAGAAKTGLFWMREEGEEVRAAKTKGRNVGLLREVFEERHKPLMEAIDNIINS